MILTQLTQCDYTYAVTYESRDDGHRLTDSYWTDIEGAGKRARELHNGIAISENLWKDNDNNYYVVDYKEVDIDPISREEAMKNLTPKQRRALGL